MFEHIKSLVEFTHIIRKIRINIATRLFNKDFFINGAKKKGIRNIQLAYRPTKVTMAKTRQTMAGLMTGMNIVSE